MDTKKTIKEYSTKDLIGTMLAGVDETNRFLQSMDVQNTEDTTSVSSMFDVLLELLTELETRDDIKGNPILEMACELTGVKVKKLLDTVMETIEMPPEYIEKIIQYQL